MTKQERLAQMLMYVQDKKSFNLKDIMEKYSVSNRTAKRDVQALKRSALRIQSTPGIKCGCKVIDGQSVQGVLLTKDELKILENALISYVNMKNGSESLLIKELIKKIRYELY